MEENYEKQFIDFLISKKGFPVESFLRNVHLVDTVGPNGPVNRYICDLVILDTENNNYLALIDFKRNYSNIRKERIRDYEDYLRVLNKSHLLFYFVIPDEINEFNIYIIKNSELSIINKNDFPNYKTLLSKVQADEKDSLKNLNYQKRNNVKRRIEILNSTLLAGLVSLFVGAIFSIVIKSQIFNDKDFDLFTTTNCCDSISSQKVYVDKKIKNLEKKIIALKVSDSSRQSKIENFQLNSIKKRLDIFENALKQNPENILKLQDLNYQLAALKISIEKEREITDIKILNFKETFSLFVTITSTLIIAIIGSLTAFAFNSFKKE